ncbi:GNAT family N-acetyltransferase [Celerinatantimonas sp. YJH-8]|uniref:GNAT family N-acetyltransferase n=1 Tax=Celerinatantimonas sp. YJH-8 TaxID=3228714 RepID=UPI0038C43CEA
MKLDHDESVFELRPIRAIDLYKFCEIMMEAARWFQTQGEILWDSEQIAPHTILAHNRIDELYLGYRDGEAVAAMILNNHCYWPQITNEQRRGSLFIHKLAISRRYAGKELSRRMLDWACRYGIEHGYSQLMLMCNCHQDKLRQLWISYGFSEIESQTVDGESCHHYVRDLSSDDILLSSPAVSLRSYR